MHHDHPRHCNKNPVGTIACAIACSMGLAVAPVSAPAASLTWNANFNAPWNSTANWNPADVPDSSDDTVMFDTVGDYTTNAMDIPGLAISSYLFVKTNMTTDLQGNALKVTAFTAQGAGSVANGTLNITGIPGSAINITSNMSVGYGANAIMTVRFADDVALNIGSNAGSRAFLRVGENTGASPSSNTSTLVAGRYFNAWLSGLTVGYRNSGYSAGITYGFINLASVTNPGILDIASNVYIGVDRMGAGDVFVGDGLDVRLGTETNRGGRLWISGYGSRSSAATPASSLVLGKGRFDAYLSELRVGEDQGSFGALNATNCSGGILDVGGDVYVGYANGGLVGGNLLINSAIPVKFGSPDTRVSLYVGGGGTIGGAGLIAVGTNRFEAYLDSFTCGRSFLYGVSGTLDLANVSNGVFDVAGDIVIGYGRGANAAIILSDQFDTTIGNPTSRVSMTLGDGDRPQSVVMTAGGRFNAYLTNLVVGRNILGSVAITDARLNLASAQTNGTLDVQGSITIGSGVDGEGTVTLPAFTACAWDLNVGTKDANSRGTLNLTGTVFCVSNKVAIDGPSTANKGRINIAVPGKSGGLDLADAATLVVSQGVISIAFAEPVVDSPEEAYPIYWGLRWQGDHLATLSNYYLASNLVWSPTTAFTNPRALTSVHIFMEANVSYVGARMLTNPKGSVMLLQ